VTGAIGRIRRAGILLPLFSMPSSRSWGIGEFGDIPAVAGWMRGAGLSLLQLLPTNEMAPGQTSPYSAISAMALDPIYISVADVPEFQALGGEGALGAGDRDAIEEQRARPAVDYVAVRALKERALRRSFERFVAHEWVRDTRRACALREWASREAWWLADYAVFRAAFHASGGRAWQEWEPALRHREPDAVERLRNQSPLEVLYREYLQWLAHAQWTAARQAASGVQLVGDFPFGVAADSADVWARQDLFAFDATAGAPPDAFSDDGQNWQLPVYRWDGLRLEGYAWFGARARRMAALVDAFRVDHVVGLFRSWVFPRDASPAHFVPGDEPSQVAQGEAVLRVLQAAGAAVIAEDLGTIPGFVRQTLRSLGIPGYRVMRWERRWDSPGQPFIAPASYAEGSLATSGTHDTETLADWWDALAPSDRVALLAVLSPDETGAAAAERPFDAGLRDVLLEALFASASDLVTVPVQDLYGWRGRINVPAVVDDTNWTWRMPWPVDRMHDLPEARERQDTLRLWAERHERR
jgi:4-alpha-glucanotransferase